MTDFEKLSGQASTELKSRGYDLGEFGFDLTISGRVVFRIVAENYKTQVMIDEELTLDKGVNPYGLAAAATLYNFIQMCCERYESK